CNPISMQVYSYKCLSIVDVRNSPTQQRSRLPGSDTGRQLFWPGQRGKAEAESGKASEIRRSKLPMNRPSPGLAATLSHRMGEGLGVRALFQWKFMAPMRVHMMCRWKLPMNLTLTRPAATLSHPMGEGLGVRALFQWKFMAPIRVHMTCRCLLPMNRPNCRFPIFNFQLRVRQLKIENRKSFMVPMCVRKLEVRATHEP